MGLLGKFRGSLRDQGLVSTARRTFWHFVHRFRRSKWRRNLRRLHQMFGSTSRKDIFEYIYRKNIWFSLESRSGFGSTLEYTENVRMHVPVILARFSIATIYDAPCGDFNWMRYCIENSNLQYTGADIVSELIQQNRKQFQSDRIKFVVRDIVTEPFPSVDLWLCRDCFAHLSFVDIYKSLENFCSSRTKYILTTNFINHEGGFDNVDIRSGDYRPIDLFSDPFYFPNTPEYRFNDYRGSPQQEMILMSREDVAKALPRMHERITS